MTSPILSKIFIYPLKSAAGIEVNNWPVNEKGLLFDRQWMLIDSNNCFLSQRQLPRMSLIKTHLTNTQLILSAPLINNLTLELFPTLGANLISVKVWNDTCEVSEISSEANAWFSEFLQVNCKLVYQPSHSPRLVDKNYAFNNEQVSFADGFPFLITSEASLTALNKLTTSIVHMQQFRPNLVISNCSAYAEDSWRKISIGNILFSLPKPCSRCVMTTINSVDASLGKEPTKTLAMHRRFKNKVYFGQNAIHAGVGTLCTGNKITIVEVGEAQPLL